MRLKGAHLDGRPWSVAILNPVDRGTIPAAISSGEAIASSGVDYASFTKDKRWHHIIDPTTLKPANHVVGSTVIGPSAATCDVLSTAVFVMGPSRTREIMARHYPQYRYWMVDAGNRVTTNIKTENPKGKPRT